MNIKIYINKGLQERLALNGYPNGDAIKEELKNHLDKIGDLNGDSTRDLVETKDWEAEVKELQGGMSQLHDAMKILRSELKVIKQEAGFI